ncbi:MAG: MATE family efflux transporter, partial [bacterium]
TTGNITRKLLSVSLPMIFDFILQALVSIVDIAIMGRLSSEAIAAVGFSRPIVWLMFSIFGGYNQAVNALVSRYFGAKSFPKAEDAAFHSLLFTTYVGIFVGALTIILLPHFLNLFAVDDNVRKLMSEYLTVVAACMVMVLYTFILTGILQGMGHTKIQLYVTAFMNISNVILSCFLILGDELTGFIPISGLGFGVKGAAWSLVISRTMGTVIMLIMLRSTRFPIRLKFQSLIPKWDIIKKMNIVGLPLGMMGVAGSTMFIAVNAIAAKSSIGTYAISALAIGQQTESFAFMPVVGLMSGVAVMVGQNLGAGEIDRAEKSVRLGAWISFVYLSFWGIMYMFYPESLVRVFSSDLNVVIPSTIYIFVFAVPVVTYSTLPFNAALRAAGDTTIPMVINIIAMYAIRIPIAWYLTLHTSLDYEGIWWAMAIGMIFENALIFLRYKQGIWKRIKL